MPRRRSGAAPLLTPPLLIILLPIIALLLIFFISITSQISRPHQATVKRGWDSLNILLVVFAILCGVFAKRNEDEPATGAAVTHEDNVGTSNENENHFNKQSRWFDHDYFDRKIYDRSPAIGGTGLKRNSNSYPDLRLDSGWDTGGDRYRFLDDFELRSTVTSSNHVDVPLRRWRSQIDESHIKVIPVDTYELTPPPPSKYPAPPPPLPPPSEKKSTRRTYESVGRKNDNISKITSPPALAPPSPPPLPLKKKSIRRTYERVSHKKPNITKFTPPPPPPPPPPRPPSTPPAAYQSEQKFAKSMKTNATREIKMVLASLYNQRKRKKKQMNTISNSYDDHYPDFHSPRQQQSVIPPPPPPPPPPPSSVFQSFFKKSSSKVKRIHSFSSPETPRRRPSSATGKPPLPTRMINYNYDRENVNSGGQSPYIPMPPPPPPPFKLPAMKFVVKGDFAKIKSERSSRASSPDLDDQEIELLSSMSSKESSETSTVAGAPSPVFCPSPDVNLKADSFIARLKGEWRLEKINSLREKRIT